MKEHPILFSTPMVQAILNGRKTQTRRVVKPQGKAACFDIAMRTDGSNKWPRNLDADERFISDMKCPYGQVGDVLWARETVSQFSMGGIYAYKADNDPDDKGTKWRPSIHMPKAACRLFLRIKSIKVERLQDISEEDAIAEGCCLYGPFGEYKGSIHPSGGSMRYRAFSNASRAFQDLWESINGENSWKANPWVWVIEFERI